MADQASSAHALIAVDMSDGNHADVYTNNMANLDGANVSLTFGVN